MSRLLVCPPDYFSIDYEINPWMRRSNAVDSKQAVRQWHHLMQVLEQDVGAVLERMKPVPRPGVHGERRHCRWRQSSAEPFSLSRTAEGRGVL